MEPIISFRDFGFQYRAQAEPTLRHINLDIYPGEKVLIAGASGSGKSTLMSCINGLIPFSYTGTSTGSLTVDGMEPQKESIFALSKSVGTVLQDPDGQFIGLTVGEDIAFSLENDCVPQEEMREIVQKTAELVSVEGHLGYAPHELSGGQKQRVNLAGRPDFVAYRFEDRDEPAFRHFKGAKFMWTIRSYEDLKTCEAWGAAPIFEQFEPKEREREKQRK